MPLKALVKDINEVPEVYRDEYTKQDDGSWLLNIEDKDFKDRLKEFRDNNITLKKEMDRIKNDAKRFEGIDPDRYQAATEAMTKLEHLEQENLLKAGNVEEVLGKRTEQMRIDYEKRLKSMGDNINKFENDAKRYREIVRAKTIDGTIRDAVSRVGNLRQGAITHVLNMAKTDWQLDDADELHAPDKFDDKGEAMSVDYWAKKLMGEHPYLFEASQGGGAQGGNKGSGAPRSGPKIVKNDPMTVGRNLEKIASGEIEVAMPGEE